MSFLNPMFLWGALAVSVPVLLHLIKRERARKIEFPTLMYLRKVSRRTIRYQKLRHLLLLLLRILAVLLLVLAFMRPFREVPQAAASPGRPTTAHILLLDNSLSMGYGDRWDRARKAAEDIARALRPGDLIALLEFSDRVRVHSQPVGNPAPILDAIARLVSVSDRPTKFSQALRVAEKVALESGTDKRVIHLISDFQKNGVSGDETDTSLSPSVEVTHVDVGAEEFSNLTFSDVKILETEETEGQGLDVKASVVNFGSEDRKAVGVSLLLDGRQAQQKRLDVDRSSTQGVEFKLAGLSPGSHAIVLELEDANLTRDNRFHMTVESRGRTPVLAVEDPSSGRGGRSPSFFLAHALNISALSPYRLSVQTAGQAAAGGILTGGLLVWNGAPPGSAALQERVQDFVKKGGGLAIVAGERLGAAEFNRSFGAWLPVKFSEPATRAAGAPSRGMQYALLTDLRLDHPVFRPFSSPHSGSFSTAKFFKYRRLEVGADAEVLARYDNGDAALAAAVKEKGRVVVFGSSADDAWNDLPLKAVFAPFWQELLRYLDARQDSRQWLEIGDTIAPMKLLSETALRLGKAGMDANQAVVVMDPKKQRVAGASGTGVVAVDLAGFYEIRTPSLNLSVGVNTVPRESDLSHGNAEEIIAGWVSREGGAPQILSPDQRTSPEEQERRNPFWKLILASVLVSLIGESVLANQSVLRSE